MDRIETARASSAAASIAASATVRASQAAVACALGVPAPMLRAPTRCKADAAFARQVAIYLARIGFEHRYADIGRAFGRERTTVSHACRVVEDRRDEPRLDRVLTALEGGLVAWLRCFGEVR